MFEGLGGGERTLEASTPSKLTLSCRHCATEEMPNQTETPVARTLGQDPCLLFVVGSPLVTV
jgi:hypothetical protein